MINKVLGSLFVRRSNECSADTSRSKFEVLYECEMCGIIKESRKVKRKAIKIVLSAIISISRKIIKIIDNLECEREKNL